MEPVEVMEHLPRPQRSLRNDQAPKADVEKIMPSQASRSLKLPDKPKSERRVCQSYACLHDAIGKNRYDEISGPLRWPHRKEWTEVRTSKEAELVKYMSNLPQYLQRVERGENLQEKALNFGVLDWWRLENWKHNQKQVPGKSTISSPSSSNSSLAFSTVGSSTFSSRHDTETSSRPRKQSTQLQSHLTSISTERHSQGVKLPRENASKSQDLKTFSKNPLLSQVKIPRTDHSPGTKHAEMKVENPTKGRVSDPNIICNMGVSSSNSESYEVSNCTKGKVEGGQAESTNTKECYCEYRIPDQHCAGKQKTIVLLLPKNSTKSNFSGISPQFESTRVYDQRPTEANRQCFSGSVYANKEVRFTNLYSDIPHSCPLPHSFEGSKKSDKKSCSSTDAQTRNIPLDASQLSPGSDGASEERHSVSRPCTPLDLKAAASKGRCLSPTRPSNFALGQMKRSLSSKDVSAVPQLNSTYVTIKSGPAGSDASCMVNSDRENNRANCRGRSSPLKRLLDPILKPRVVNCRHSMESVQDESTPMCGTWKSSEEMLECSKVTPVKRDLYFTTSNPISTDDSHLAEKHEMVQALLKVTVKDGLQSLAFAVDNNSNILIATMKKTGMTGKYDCSWIYTFYSFHKIKKKSGGWINQGSKGKNHDFKPKMVGQMKVSGSRGLESARHDSKDPFILREFVLLGVEQRQAVKSVQDLQPQNELAAIVVKVPKHISGSLSGDGWCSTNYENVAEMEFPECFLEERGSCNSRDSPPYEPCIRSQSLSSTIVILPSGVHGLPSKGVPSPLIDRWRSGGSCDCGGWDMGCNLRILASSNSSSSSNDFCSPDHVVLSYEGGAAQEKKPVFTLGTFKGGICAVNFSSSISSLQAFSICAALLHSMKLAELSEVSNLIEDKVAQDFTTTIKSRIKVPTRVEGDAPPTHIPFPPLSPVGRV